MLLTDNEIIDIEHRWRAEWTDRTKEKMLFNDLPKLVEDAKRLRLRLRAYEKKYKLPSELREV